MTEKKDIFPFIGVPEDYNYIPESELPPLKELAYDFERDDFIIDEDTKEFKVVEGAEALKVWIYMAIKTIRFNHEIYSWDYGTELNSLIGQKFSRGLTESEAFRFIKEALLINPYINDVENRGITFTGDDLHIRIKVKSIYGGIDIDV
nr:MAG TPA: Protein of unknown function (DUF2634) [Caudoviricetes sp.]